MAVPSNTVQERLRQLEMAYEHDIGEAHRLCAPEHYIEALQRKYTAEADKFRRYYPMDNDMMNSIFGAGQIAGQQGQIFDPNRAAAAQNQLQNFNPAAMQNATKAAAAEEGVLMFRGAPLPEVWRGAEYKLSNRAQVAKQWKMSFTSDYASDTIMLWLSSETHSGLDADKVALTYLETINQRRLS